MAVIQIICPIICSFFRNLLTLHCQKIGIGHNVNGTSCQNKWIA